MDMRPQHDDHPRNGSAHQDQESFRALLHAQRVRDAELPAFDMEAAPDEPLPLFFRWFTEVVAAGQPEPHTMTLATAGADGLPDQRVLTLHDADERGWHFATHATSRKGRQLAERPYASIGFHWPVLGRAVRIRGRVTIDPAGETSADLHARSTGALAAALAGRQSEVLGSTTELARVYEATWRRAAREPGTEAPSWTGYVVTADEVEFYQGEVHRRHVRLCYHRTDAGPWRSALLWP
jgi:pyridoxamine 5'-phosphate oxidase